MKIYDVVIVGAGPVGLATAIGLHKHNLEKVLIIDQTSAFRQAGQFIDILPNGLKALKCLESKAYEEIKKIGIAFLNPQLPPKWITRNLQGEIIQSNSLSFDQSVEDYGEGRVGIPWYTLQTTLRNLLPQDWIQINHRCVNLVEELENQCIRIDCVSEEQTNPYAYWGQENHERVQTKILDFAPTQTEIKSLRAKLVVGADGINSTTRKILYRDSLYSEFAYPEYSGYASILCIELTEISKELKEEIKNKFLEDSLITTITNNNFSKASLTDISFILFNNPNGNLGYMVHLPLSYNLVQKAENNLIDLLLEELEKAGFSSALKQLVKISPLASVQLRPYYIHRASTFKSEGNLKIQTPWNMGRCVLVGDAAHGMPPFMAQGVNQGFEDALAIVKIITKIAEQNNWNDKQTIVSAFGKYEDFRRSFVEYVQKATLTRFPYLSNLEWQKYSQEVFGRNFD